MNVSREVRRAADALGEKLCEAIKSRPVNTADDQRAVLLATAELFAVTVMAIEGLPGTVGMKNDLIAAALAGIDELLLSRYVESN